MNLNRKHASLIVPVTLILFAWLFVPMLPGNPFAFPFLALYTLFCWDLIRSLLSWTGSVRGKP